MSNISLAVKPPSLASLIVAPLALMCGLGGVTRLGLPTQGGTNYADRKVAAAVSRTISWRFLLLCVLMIGLLLFAASPAAAGLVMSEFVVDTVMVLAPISPFASLFGLYN